MNQVSLRILLSSITAIVALSLHIESSEGDEGVYVRVDTASPASADRSLDHCIRRQGVWDGDNYNLQLANVCDETVRVHWCVRQSDGDNHCQVHPFVPPRGSVDGTARDAARPVDLRFEACPTGERCRVRR